VRHEFGKNGAIDKYFGTRIKNCAISEYDASGGVEPKAEMASVVEMKAES